MAVMIIQSHIPTHGHGVMSSCIYMDMHGPFMALS